MEDYPSNSKKAQREHETTEIQKRKSKKVIVGKSVQRKKPMSRRIAQDVRRMAKSIITEILIPTAKDLVHEIVESTADRTVGNIKEAIYGEGHVPPRRVRRSSERGNHTDYNRFSSRESRREERRPTVARNRDLGEYILGSRAEAEEVLAMLDHYLEEYEQVTIKDYLELIDQPYGHTDEKWGWTELGSAKIIRAGHNAWFIDLPRQEFLGG